MTIKELFPENERVERIVYVVQHDKNEFTNTIIESKVDAEYKVEEDGFKRLWGTLHPAAPFKNGGEFQVFRFNNNETTSTNGGMDEEDFEEMLNSTYFDFLNFHVFTTKKEAEFYVKTVIGDAVFKLEEQIKNMKHINFSYFSD